MLTVDDSYITSDFVLQLAGSTLSTKDECHARDGLEEERDSAEKCMSNAALGRNQAREHGTLSPRDTFL